MLTFVLSSEKCLVVLFWTFFQYLGNNSISKKRNYQKFCWCRDAFLK